MVYWRVLGLGLRLPRARGFQSPLPFTGDRGCAVFFVEEEVNGPLRRAADKDLPPSLRPLPRYCVGQGEGTVESAARLNGAGAMETVVLRKPRVLERVDLPVPRLTERHHVRIGVGACGICGSDLRYYVGENPWALHTLGKHC